MADWIKGKQSDPYRRPRIDWIATWKPFVPFWIVVLFIASGVFVLHEYLGSKPQKEWECRPSPGYCDVDLDWYQTHKPKR